MRPTTMLSTLPSPLISTGEARKRRTMRRGLPSRLALRELGEDVDVLARGHVGLVGLEEGAADLVELAVGGVDDDVGSTISPSSRTSGLVNAACAGPRRPRTTISRMPLSAIGLDRVVGGVGLLELVARQGEHPRDVGGDVAVADHDGALAGEVELVVGEVGVGVVPGDELGGRAGCRGGPRRGCRAGGRSRLP